MEDRASRRSLLAVVGAGTLGVAGCLGSDDAPDGASDDEPSDEGEGGDEWDVDGSPLEASFEAAVVVENLDVPWDIAFAPDGDVFLTERPGRIRRTTAAELAGDTPLDATDLPEEPIELPDIAPDGEGGALGIAVHPAYPEPPSVYVFYTAETESRVDRVVRYDATDVGEVETIVDDLPGAVHHNGGRVAFGPDDQLWITRGDVSEPELSQDPGSLVGSLLRVTPDGEPAGADDAPEDADPMVYTYGHRNTQGIDWLPDGTPITTEHGPVARDEVVLHDGGRNYGWPIARGGTDDEEYDAYDESAEFAPPLASSGTIDGEETWAPSGGTWYDDSAIPELRNRFLFAGLRSQRLHVLTLLDPDEQPPDDATEVHDEPWLDERFLAVRHELLVEEFGRLRHVAQDPDGALYLLTSNEGDADDVIVRLDPT
ncbi:sorbosone dehydrogenase family protein [Halovivax sp.]|uniref:PQQ-dependent sugar dehydrogenase n=1 Tax=Halovivax sp. TaxID=1935978 RepID=UPI0025BFA0C3|nr:PQQ-dependent sugar dehydrogenase [Halovivax sp.]